ncbi:MAG: 4-hydroxy-3-methylbut-2-enyl diphosphate reductase [Planctomycetota bacterium]|nr:4-hydroxy-3-methylbut-2-enyl diphosphate reductase [Planctomycetota bacterium]
MCSAGNRIPFKETRRVMSDYHRKYFGLKKEVAPVLEGTYASRLVDLLRLKGYEIDYGGLTVRLATEFGFCVGVERSIQMAYETRRMFPDKRIFITAEIIHNAYVNKQLVEMGCTFLNGQYKNGSFEDIGADDVVILPAFGASVEEIEEIKKKGAFIVDSTCGAVVSVWNNVHRYAKDDFTSLIHGKYSHEETIATASRATGKADGFTGSDVGKKGKYLIVRDMEEAKYVCEYIIRGGNREEFLRKFKHATSVGFDPDRDLERLGVANQTTMLSSETLAIQGAMRAAFVQKYGEGETLQRVRSADTICSATQDRQDAMGELLARKRPDVLIVIGGYNSSNTGHLAEMGIEKGVPTYHIDDASCLTGKREIRHQPIGAKATTLTEDWWPGRPRPLIGITAGASTPNNKIGDVFVRLFELNGADLDRLMAHVEALPTPELTEEEKRKLERMKILHGDH